MSRKFFIALVLAGCSVANNPKTNNEDQQLVSNLQQHIHYLADDKLEGRRTGTQGEKLAGEYISNEFRKIGLTPKGSNDFLQPFEVNEGKQVNASTHLAIDGKTLQPEKDFFPLPFSANGSVEAMPSIALQESSMPWFLDLKDMLQANSANPHFDVNDAIATRAKTIQKKGATALFVYNTSKIDDGIKFDARDKTEMVLIPVVYITKDVAKKFLSDPSAMLDIKLKTDIGEKKRTGNNVAGFIDNGAATTIVIGAHYDHLGYGEDHNSRYTGTDMQVHNGADDNASGTAALIELARLLKGSNLKHNNYLFIAFSGEELGLYGSKYFVEHPTIPLNSVNYMINMDMVGRLNDSSHVITVGGYGTSPAWGQAYNSTGKKKLYEDGLAFRFDSSGTGPSDHTSFYLKDIPVLFYFTGLHTDYHKPSDDFDKINYNGEMKVVKHVMSLIDMLNDQSSKLTFLKTREQQTSTNTRFAVTLGIMPDYTYPGAGIRVDGVSDNRPAQKAGLKAGDVIISVGDYKTSSMETYMQALGKFKKGDKATVIYKRGTQTLSTSVEF